MAYATGIANSATDLISAVNATCAANGWTLDAPSGVLSKGNVHVKLLQKGGASLKHVAIEYGATSNFASPGYNAAGRFAYLRFLGTFPVFYRIFILSDGAGGETVMVNVLEANLTEWKHITFGSLANKVGTWTGGEFISATYASNTSALTNENTTMNGGPGLQIDNLIGGTYAKSYGFMPAAPFVVRDVPPNFGGDFVHVNTYLRCDVEATGPNCSNTHPDAATLGTGVDCMRFISLALARQPNLWNGESVLVPIHVRLYRASDKVSRLGTVYGLRFMRMDNYEPGDIITLGTERWMVLPIFRRNQTTPLGSNSGFQTDTGHSGQLAFAIKYDGA